MSPLPDFSTFDFDALSPKAPPQDAVQAAAKAAWAEARPTPEGVDLPHFALPGDLQGTELHTHPSGFMKEVGVYTVKDGKVVQEEFFYAPPSM